MPDVVAQFVAASDNANEYADDRRKKIKPQALEDIDALLSSVEDRDDEFWESVGVDSELTVSDFDSVPINDRNIDWSLDFSGIVAAAGLQFFLDNREELILKPAAYRMQVVEPFNLTREQLQRAGRREILRIPLEGYKALQARYMNEFQALRAMKNAELFTELQSIGALQPFDKYVADSMGYVSRMTTHPPGSPQFKEAVADLVNLQSDSAQMSMNRRSVEALSVERQTSGELNMFLCWVLDPSSKHCDYCPARAGEIRTYAEWIETGLPGADVCRGGDRCNCHLVAV